MATTRGQKPGLAATASNGKTPAPSPANAWARPLKTTGPPPGMGPAEKARPPSSGNSKPAATGNSNNNNTNGAATYSTIHRERLLHLSLTLIGQKVVVTLTDGAVLEGVFHTFTPFDGLDADVKNKYVLNMVKVIKPGKDNSIKNGMTLILAVEKVTQLYAKSINLDRPNKNGAGAYSGKGGNSDLVTDTQISGTRASGNRDLVAAGNAWTSASGGKQTRAEALAGSLGGGGTGAGKGADTSGLKGSIGGWDQFKANQELFNVNASFDENLYTTALDKTQIDARRIAEAERIAREIETTASTNLHVAEERGQAVETDYDEEDRYSGVLTKDGKQRHESQQDKVAVAAAPKKIMNYAAAAAAKADPAKKSGPPGFGGTAKPATATTDAKPTAEGVSKAAPEQKKESPAPAPKLAATEETKKEEKATDSAKVDTASTKPDAEKKGDETKTEEKKAAAKTSKLNANAKEFTFNPAAKSFTPSFGGGGFGAPPQQPQHMDPNMQMHGGHPLQPPQYMHAMGQPGMMPMMSPQYPGMRYQPQFPGMDHHGVPQMQPHQPQHVQAPAGTPPPSGQPSATGASAPASQGAPAPPAGEGDSAGAPSQDGESSQPSVPSQQGPQSQQQQQQPLQQPMVMPYNVPPQGAYFAGGGMGMHPRGPGGYPPHFGGGPQQMPGGPQGAPYGRQMYPMQPGGMPPNMHMRGPGGVPYFAGPNGPMPYPPGAYGHGMMDDGDGGFRGRGRGQGRGRGRRGGRGGRGPGRGHYQQQQPYGSGPHSGRSTPQQHGMPDQGDNMPPPQGPPPAPEGEKTKTEGTPPEASS